MADANRVISILKTTIAEQAVQLAILRAEFDELQERTAQDAGMTPVDLPAPAVDAK
jgi:hypothetical protein